MPRGLLLGLGLHWQELVSHLPRGEITPESKE